MDKEDLKTLKDFEIDSIGRHTTSDLKAEAVKWVKREQENLPQSWFDNCEMMIDFFNLTNEDLK